MKAFFNLPDFCCNLPTYRLLFELYKTDPYVFLPNTDFSCIYGCVNNVIWNGGGVVLGEMLLTEQIEELVSFYNDDLNIPLRLTYTNPLLTENMCYDTYANLVTEVFHNGKNEILVNSPILEQYLKKNYPNFKYCRSILAAKDVYYDPSYYLSVLKRDMNNNWDYLDSIPLAHRQKIEILCTDVCPPDCPRIYSHYKDLARIQLTYSTDQTLCACDQMDKRGKFSIYTARHSNPKYVTRELIDNEYLPRGYQQFKISGRTLISSAIVDCLEYLIKPEYKPDLALMLFNQYTS